MRRVRSQASGGGRRHLALLAGAAMVWAASGAMGQPSPPVSGGGGAAAGAANRDPQSQTLTGGDGSPVQADRNPDEQFAVAGRLYAEGRFSEAARAWHELVDRGYESPALYFNLANAFLKSGELGEAIVYYERAHALDPRAADIQANLTYARSLVVDVMPETESSVFLETLVRFKNIFSAGEAVRGAALLLWLGLGAAAVSRLSRARLKRVARQVAVGLLVAFGLVGALAAFKVHEVAGLERAVLVTPEVAVRAGPGESYSSRFSLHEGTAVRVERQASGWTEIQLTPTLGGWVPSHVLMSL